MFEPVTIAILSRNRSWLLNQCVASIREFTKHPYRILIQDHGSDLHHREHMKRLLLRDDVQIVWRDDFLSCAEGRRTILDQVESEYVAYMDDDEKVAPHWLSNMVSVMRTRPACAAVTANMVIDGRQMMSGARMVRGQDIIMAKWGYTGSADACAGGCTLYRTDVLRATEYRPEFNAGYEDWDQTLQITRDLRMTVWASRAALFHNHIATTDYLVDRWRMTELMDAAIAIWDRWRIRTAIEKVFKAMHDMGVPLQERQIRKVIVAAGTGRSEAGV